VGWRIGGRDRGRYKKKKKKKADKQVLYLCELERCVDRICVVLGERCSVGRRAFESEWIDTSTSQRGYKPFFFRSFFRSFSF